MPKKARKHIEKTIHASASNSRVENRTADVEKMNTHLYTFSYTTQPNCIHLYKFTTMIGKELFDDITYVFQIYQQKGVISAYSCDVLGCESPTIMNDLLTLSGAVLSNQSVWTCKDEVIHVSYFTLSIPESKHYSQAINFFFEQTTVQYSMSHAPSSESAPNECTIPSSSLPGYVDLLDIRWIIPVIDMNVLECKPVPTYLSNELLRNWYQESFAYLPYSTVIERCTRLIEQHKDKMDSPLSTEKPEEELNQEKDSTKKEILDLYLKLYLEPAKPDSSDPLLSEVYAHYEEICKQADASYVTFFTFNKALRSMFPNEIKRKSKGIVLMGYQIVQSHVRLRLPLPSFTEFNEVEKQSIPFRDIPFSREAICFLSLATTLPITASLLQLFLSDPTIRDVMKSYRETLDQLCRSELDPKFDPYPTDDTLPRMQDQFNKRIKYMNEPLRIPYPFHKETYNQKFPLFPQMDSTVFLPCQSFERDKWSSSCSYSFLE